MGSPSRCSLMLLVEMMPYYSVLASAFCFHSGAPSKALMLMLRSSWAKWRSPASGNGSSATGHTWSGLRQRVLHFLSRLE